MANITEIGAILVIKNLTGFNSGLGVMRKQMGITGSSARSFANTFNSSMSGMGQSVLNAGRTVRSFGNELTFLGFQLTFLATGAFAAVTAAGSEFESTIVRMSTLANVAVKDLESLANEAQGLSSSVGVGPTELADAMFDIVSSGFSAAEAMEIIEATSKGAAIGLGDVRTVTDTVTSAMKAYAGEGLTAGRATDILVQAVREGKGEVDKLAGTMGRVLGIAGQMGISFEETAAFIATFTRVGVPAEVAVTSLRSALTNILKPTAAANTALAKYGLTMADIKTIISEQGLAQGLITLSAVLSEDDEAFSRVIGSARGLAGVLITTGPLLEDYKQVLAAIKDSAGATGEAFDLFAQTTEFKLNVAKAAFESLFITVSNTLRPIVNIILDQIPKITAALEEMVKVNPKILLFVGSFAAFVAAMGPVLIIVGLSITSIGTLISVLGTFAVALGALISIPGAVVTALTAFAVTFVGLFVASFEKTNQKLGEQGRAISFNAYAWGRNIIIQFAKGMAEAVVYVFKVLTQLAIGITKLLKPGSPPKLLPDLDKWGKGAMEAYMAGWLEADFSVFQNLAQTIESFLRSIGLEEIDVVPAIMDIRLALAGLIDTFRATGQVSIDAINAITASFGNAGAVVGQYIQAMLKLEAANMAVKAAQDALNGVQEKYNALLKPISDELEAISRQRQQIVDDMRIAELQEILDDPTASPLARQLAEMELREIELRRQQQTIEDVRDTEVEAAQDTLDAAVQEQQMAEARARALLQFIQIQEKNNQLIEEQIDLLKRLADALDNVGGAGGAELEDIGAGGAPEIEPPDIDLDSLFGGLDPDILQEAEDLWRKIGDPEEGGGLGSLSILFAQLQAEAETFLTEMSGIGEEIAKAWEPAITAGNELTDAWSDVFALDLGDVPFFSDIDTIPQRLEETFSFIGEWITLWEGAWEKWQPLWEAIGEVFTGSLGDIDLSIGSVTQTLTAILLLIFPLTAGMWLFVEVIEFINGAIETLPGKLIAAQQAAGDLSTAIENFVVETWGKFVTWAGQTVTIIETWAGDIVTKIETGIANFVQSIFGGADKAEKRLGRMSKDGSGFIETMKDNIIGFVEDLKAGVDERIGKLKELLVGEDGYISKIKQAGIDLFFDMKEGMLEKIGELQAGVDIIFQEFITWVGGQIENFKNVGRNIGQGLYDGIKEKVQPLMDLMEGMINDLYILAEKLGIIDSPSKRSIELGHHIMDGLRIGLEDRYQVIQDSLTTFMDDLFDQSASIGVDFHHGQHGSEQGQASMAGISQAPITHMTSPPVMNNSSNRESNFGPIYVQTGMNVAQLRSLIRQEVNGSL